MAVENTIVKNIYMGNGVTTEFPITFQIGDEHPEYVIVYITDATGVTRETDNFIVNLETKVVTYPKSGEQLPADCKITIYRKLPLYQLLNLVNQGPFFAENIESALDDITFMMQQLSENLNRTLSASVDVVNFNTNFPVKAGKGIRINDAGDGLELTEDPAKVLPLAKEILKQTEQVKENTITETTQIKNETIEAKNTAVAAAETAAVDTVKKASEFLDGKVKAAALSANTAVEAANTAVSSAKNAATNASSAVESATTATEQADRAQDIADSLEGLAGITGIASTEEAIAGESDTKAMTPSKTKEAVAAQVPEIMRETLQNKADIIDGKVPTEQLPEMDYVPNSEVGNAANKIPKYNTAGHLVLPDGSEFWIG
jgi:predicted Holliday junction resolvase-like endonuclease